jgi:FkbM family methyltransferase
MHYKFIDIGCGHWGVSSDIFGTDVVGMYVEPIKQYLDVLPCGDNITKVCSAIGSFDGVTQLNALLYDAPYYTISQMHEIFIDKKKYDDFVKKYDRSGCSSLLQIEKDRETSLKIDVDCMTLGTLFQKYDVTSIEYLKLDVEGYEETVLKQLLVLLHNKDVTITKEIKFECNELSDAKKLNNIADIMCNNFGFTKKYVAYYWDQDIILTKI